MKVIRLILGVLIMFAVDTDITILTRNILMIRVQLRKLKS